MKLNVQKRLAAQILGCSEKRISFDPAELEEIKDAITKKDIRRLIGDGIITARQVQGISRGRAKQRHVQRRKGLREGDGRRKGTANARLSRKRTWINAIRTQRTFLKELKDKELITQETFTGTYRKAKGGYFRSRRHIKLYLEENRLIHKADKKTQAAAKQAINDKR
jgi:large subunit ribosomal protein L19e